MKRIIALLLSVLMCLMLCACGIEKQTLEINYGEERIIELKKQHDGIVWETANPDIVTVSNGTVTAMAPGNTVVTAMTGDKSVAEITVTVNVVDISAILFSQKNVEIELEESTQLEYLLVPDNASDYGLSWKSANTQIAEVDEKGMIRAVAPGTTTIVCSAPNGVLDTCEVVVKEPSAIEQLNEYEKWLFDVMIAKFLPSFYNAPAARIRKIENFAGIDNYEKSMILLVNMQGTNRFGGTLIKDYVITCSKDIDKSAYIPCMTESGLVDRSKSNEHTEATKLDSTKINAALEEYWNGNIHN